MEANEAIKTPQFYYLWFMLFTNVTCGIAVIAVAKFIGLEVMHFSAAAAAFMVMMMSICNGFGRIGWATISDYLTRPVTYTLFFVLQIVLFYTLTLPINAFLFQILVLVILTCYGGGFALVPAFIGDMFGNIAPSAIHGYILTAWAAAGLVGPTVIAYLMSSTGSYISSFYFFIGLMSIALCVSLLMFKQYHVLKEKTIAT